MHPDTAKYNDAQDPDDREICHLLAEEIDRHLPEAENRIWHAHPVWGTSAQVQGALRVAAARARLRRWGSST